MAEIELNGVDTVSPLKKSRGVKSDGRIVYIDPTEFAKYELQKNTEGSENIDNVTWNPEDLQYTVDLQVICPERYNKNSSVNYYNTNFHGEHSTEWISFMQGKDFSDGKATSNYLTDAYTEISFQEFKNGERSPKEYLGINSIDISFDSHFFPIVNMKFTDVRAAALFGPSDNEYVQTKRIESAMNVLGKNISQEERERQQEKIKDARDKMSSSFFKSLFRFPYPRFMLTVMGFYGDRVTFQLAVSDFKTNFDANTGNFEVNVSFIGYMYGIYTDIPMSLVFTSPYYNREYWDQQKEAGIFVYNEGNPMHTFIEYFVAYYSLFKDDVLTTDNYSVNAFSKLTVEQSMLENITVLLEEFEGQMLDSVNTKLFWTPDKNDPNVYIVFFDYDSVLPLDPQKYEKLKTAINEYNEKYAYNDNRVETLDITHLSKFQNATCITKVNNQPNTVTAGYYCPTQKTDNTWNNTIEIGEGGVTSVEKNNLVNLIENDGKPYPIPGISEINSNTGKLEVIYGGKGQLNYYIYDRVNILEVINNRLKVIENEINNLQDDIDEETLKLISQKLKFKPSIENIYRMIFAHIETFINSIETEVLNKIESKKNTELRKAGYLGLDNTNSDIPKINYNYDTFIPPFPLCKNKNDGKIAYPGNFYSSAKQAITEIDEVAYIEKILRGIRSFNVEYEDAKRRIESLTDKTIRGFVPSLVTDILYKNLNPYINLRDYIDEKALSKDDRKKYIAYFFLSRIIMFTVNNFPAARLFSIYFSIINDVSDVIIKNEMSNLISSRIPLEDIKASFASDEIDALVNENNLTGIYGNIAKKLTNKCCYFFKNAFDLDDDNNRYYNNDKGSFEIIDMDDYQIALQPFKESVENKDHENKNKIQYNFGWSASTEFSKYWYKSDSYSTSCITGTVVPEKKLVRKLEEGNFLLPAMRSDYSQNGEGALSNYGLGSLPIGEPVGFWRNIVLSESPGSEIETTNTIDHQYHTYIQYDIEKFDILRHQTNEYFKAFLLLGSLSTYFNRPNDGIIHLYETTYNSVLFNIPEVLYLYFGACVYFREKGFDLEGIYTNGNSIQTNQSAKYEPHYDWEIALKQLPVFRYLKNYFKYNTNSTPILYDKKDACYVLNLFTSSKNYFLTKSTLKNDSTDNILVKSSRKQDFYDMKEYFIKWVENKHFSTIYKRDIKDNQNGITSRHMLEVKDTSLVAERNNVKVASSLYYAKGNNSIGLKALICRDLYLLKRPIGITGDDFGAGITKYSCSEFLKKVKTICSDLIRDAEDKKTKEQEEEDRKAGRASEQKKTLYQTLKRLYDRWLAAYKLQGVESMPFHLHTPEDDANFRSDRYEYDKEIDYTEFNSFIFVDSFYRDISNKFIINPDTLLNLVKSYTEKDIMDSNASVFEFMNELAENNNLLFASLPVYNNLYNVSSISRIFKPNRKYGANATKKHKIPGNTYMIMYVGEPSSKLDFGDSGYDDDAIKDVFLAGEDKLPTELKDLFTSEKGADESISFSIPVFGVAYDKQNQMYFKSVTVNMDNPKLTDYSIANLISISYGGAHGDADDYNVGIGQDLYSIYTNRSYTCTVEMMGCLNIMPMMYFQLNNIPMLRGFYIIIHVSHSIVPGNITTKFTGVRVSRNHLGEVKAIFDYQSMYEKFAANNVEIQYTTNEGCYQYKDEPLGEYKWHNLSDFFRTDSKLCNIPSPNDPALPFNKVKSRINEMYRYCIEPLVYAWKEFVEGDPNCKNKEWRVTISSGFRSQAVNTEIGGSSTSAHKSGYAVDLKPKNGEIKLFKAFVYYWLTDGVVMKLGGNYSYDQFIDEVSANGNTGGWVHLGFKKDNGNGNTEQRREFLGYRGGSYTALGKNETLNSNGESFVRDNYSQYYSRIKPYVNKKWW